MCTFLVLSILQLMNDRTWCDMHISCNMSSSFFWKRFEAPKGQMLHVFDFKTLNVTVETLPLGE